MAVIKLNNGNQSTSGGLRHRRSSSDTARTSLVTVRYGSSQARCPSRAAPIRFRAAQGCATVQEYAPGRLCFGMPPGASLYPAVEGGMWFTSTAPSGQRVVGRCVLRTKPPALQASGVLKSVNQCHAPGTRWRHGPATAERRSSTALY